MVYVAHGCHQYLCFSLQYFLWVRVKDDWNWWFHGRSTWVHRYLWRLAYIVLEVQAFNKIYVFNMVLLERSTSYCKKIDTFWKHFLCVEWHRTWMDLTHDRLYHYHDYSFLLWIQLVLVYPFSTVLNGHLRHHQSSKYASVSVYSRIKSE